MNEPLSPSESIQAAYEKATPGEWSVEWIDCPDIDKWPVRIMSDMPHPEHRRVCTFGERSDYHRFSNANAAFIARVHNHWPAVAAHLAQLSRELDAERVENTARQITIENLRAREDAALAENARLRTIAEKAIDDESEFPGPIPTALYLTLQGADKDTVAESLRLAVRLTKAGIRERLAAALSSPPQAAGGATT